jgi:hypothetical protein
MFSRQPQSLVRPASVALALACAANALGSATITNGVLSINTTAFNTDQQIEVVVGPVVGSVTLSGVIGATQTTFTGVTSISLKSGPAQDAIEFRMFAPTLPTVTIETGTGNSDVKVIYDPSSAATTVVTNVTHIGANNNDKTTFEVLSGAPSLIASWSVQAGGGNNEAFGIVQSPDVTDLLAIAFNMRGGTGVDKLDLSVVSDAAAVDLTVNPFLGGGNDSVFVFNDALSTGNLNMLSFASLGDGLDIFELGNVQRGGSSSFFGNIDGGNGNDSLKFTSEAPGAMNLTLNGNGGSDTIDWFGKGLITGTPQLLGGAGNDVLKLIVDGPQAATPFIDGGAGFDIAIGFGTIVNCEQVN